MPDSTLEYKTLEPEQVTEFMSELRTGERVVSITDEQGRDHILVFRKISRALDVNMRIVYTRMYQTYLKAGVPTRADARKTFMSLLDPKTIDPNTFEEKRQAIQKKLIENLAERTDEAKAKNISQSAEALVQTMTQNLRTLSPDEMALLNVIAENEQLEASIMANCAETMAEADAQLYLMSQTVFNSDGTPLWADFNEAANETDLVFLTRLREEHLRFLQGYPLFFQVTLPTPDQMVIGKGDSKKESPSS